MASVFCDAMFPAVVTDVVGIVRSLGDAGVPSVVVSEYAKSSTFWSRHCTEHRTVSDFRANPDEALHVLEALGEKYPFKPVLFTGRESDTLFVSRNRDRLSKSFRMKMPSSDLLEALGDKWAFAQIAARLSIPTPRTWRPMSAVEAKEVIKELTFPCILKPFGQDLWLREEIYAIVGKWKKAKLVFTPDELLSLFTRLMEVDDRFLIQEFIPGGDESLLEYNGYCPSPGNVVASYMTRKLRTYPIHFGQGCYVRTWSDAEVERLGREALEKLGYVGGANVDFKVDPRTNQKVILEINPRLGLSCHLGARAGVNLPLALYRDLMNQPAPSFRPSPLEHRWLWFAFDLRAIRDYRKAGEWTIYSWLRSLFHYPIVCFRFDMTDPMPLLRSTIKYMSDKLRRVFRI